MQEVIPMSAREAYRATDVNWVNVEELAGQDETEAVVVGLDVGKFEVLAMVRWADGRWQRPWRARNPEAVGLLAQRLSQLARGRSLRVAMESTGTYGDPLRQALTDAGLTVHRVSSKAAHDYAEIFDGVPSQHDGKDAAVVAELAALGKSWPWPYQAADVAEQEMARWVDWLDMQRRIESMWQGRLEALLARHWPEATRRLKISSATLLRALAHYGGPAALGADPDAVAQLSRWGHGRVPRAKLEQFVAEAARSVGVRQTAVDRRRVGEYAQQALAARHQTQESFRQLERLAGSHPGLAAQAEVVGAATACVLWVCLGDPRQYPCGEAYRKAMGLNLAERSSGTYQGRLHISKRGAAMVRRWMYFAALRLVKTEAVKSWYRIKKSKDAGQVKRALIAVDRKLALALYQVGARGEPFDPRRLFPGRQWVNRELPREVPEEVQVGR